MDGIQEWVLFSLLWEEQPVPEPTVETFLALADKVLALASEEEIRDDAV